MKLLIMFLIALTIEAKNLKQVYCYKLLNKSVHDLNKAYEVKTEGSKKMYSLRSLAASNLFEICIEASEDYSTNRVKTELRKIR